MGQHSKNNEIIYSFLEASTPMLEEIEEIIHALKVDPQNSQLLNSYFRLLYSIKGTANCVGLVNIPKFAQKYGECIGKLQWQQTIISPEILEALSKGLDHLKHLYTEAHHGRLENEEDNNFDFEQNFSSFFNKRNLVSQSNEKIGVPINVLDKFMELSSQFTVLRNTLTKSAMELEQRYYGDKEIEIMVDSLAEMHKVSSTLQNDISEMRKINMDVIYKSLRCIVRDTSKDAGKNVDFKISGEDLKIDTSISKMLGSVLSQILRYTIDNSLEKPDVRSAINKNESAVIQVKSYEESDNIIIEVVDDGAGLKISDIKEKALEKGLYNQDQLSAMSEQKIMSLVFEPGYLTSTNDDSVRSQLDSFSGKIIIESRENHGTKFVIINPIPRSVLIIKSLMIKFSESIYSIPLDSVAEVVCLEDFKDSKVLHNIENSLIFRHHDELLPLVDLGKSINNDKNVEHDQVMNVVIVKDEGLKYGIIVDEIMDIEEIVVKKMSPHLKKSDFFMGVTFIGHGDLSLILDLGAIAKNANIHCNENTNSEHHFKQVVVQNDNMEFMQFSLRHSNNYAFPLAAINRLEEFKTADIEYSGSIPLVRYREEPLPLLFIERQLGMCPVEDNIATYYPDIVKVIVVNLHNKIYGIVVDQIVDIGITAAQVVTDNIDRDGFLGTVFINEHTITILDVNYLISNYLDFEGQTSEKEYEEVYIDAEEWYGDKAA